MGRGDELASRKSGKDDELRRASGATDSSEGLCGVDGTRGRLEGRAGCLFRSLRSRGSLVRDDETFNDRASSGSECP